MKLLCPWEEVVNCRCAWCRAATETIVWRNPGDDGISRIKSFTGLDGTVISSTNSWQNYCSTDVPVSKSLRCKSGKSTYSMLYYHELQPASPAGQDRRAVFKLRRNSLHAAQSCPLIYVCLPHYLSISRVALCHTLSSAVLQRHICGKKGVSGRISIDDGDTSNMNHQLDSKEPSP